MHANSGLNGTRFNNAAEAKAPVKSCPGIFASDDHPDTRAGYTYYIAFESLDTLPGVQTSLIQPYRRLGAPPGSS